jgi:3-deoxy-D-manno-octulosonic-acid transferase
MRTLYTAGIRIYGWVIHLAALVNPKAKSWVRGRRNEKPYSGGKILKGCIWMHCASLGEFEQGRPVLEKLRKSHPATPILLTFFSPSGYDIRKNYQGADHVAYLPLDTPSNARIFLETYQPGLAIFVKYEIWHNFLHTLKKQQIPTVLISAIFRKDHFYFKPGAGWFRASLRNMTRIFAQDSRSVERLRAAGIENAFMAGDTRFDRVSDIQKLCGDVPAMEVFAEHSKLLVAGSTWEQDELLLRDFFDKHKDRFPNLKLVIVPHEISSSHISKLREHFRDANLWTEITPDTPSERVLIVNTIGQLSSLYKYAYVAYIGGGFGAGIHNILEPAAFAKPIVFGPTYEKFKEATDLLTLGGARTFENFQEMEHQLLQLLTNHELYHLSADAAGIYVKENLGATDKICAYISSVL